MSISDRIINTIIRAFAKRDDDNEPMDEVWIALILGPSSGEDDTMRIHSAAELATQCDMEDTEDSYIFKHEYLVEHFIPEERVLHKVTLQTLVDCGLREHWNQGKMTRESCSCSAEMLRRSNPWEIGLVLGNLARTFVVRAPSNWIAIQLFYDCFRVKVMDYGVTLTDVDDVAEVVYLAFFRSLHDGINTAVVEWWLADVEFVLDHQGCDVWKDETEGIMEEELADCWRVCHSIGPDGAAERLSLRERLIYEGELDNLHSKHERQREAIEAQAVRQGL